MDKIIPWPVSTQVTARPGTGRGGAGWRSWREISSRTGVWLRHTPHNRAVVCVSETNAQSVS